jgi:hypothetical protein
VTCVGCCGEGGWVITELGKYVSIFKAITYLENLLFCSFVIHAMKSRQSLQICGIPKSSPSLLSTAAFGKGFLAL